MKAQFQRKTELEGMQDALLLETYRKFAANVGTAQTRELQIRFILDQEYDRKRSTSEQHCEKCSRETFHYDDEEYRIVNGQISKSLQCTECGNWNSFDTPGVEVRMAAK